MTLRFKPSCVLGIDFSGAKLAGDNIWIAELSIGAGVAPRLVALSSLRAMSGFQDREPALQWLVGMLLAREQSLVGIDFPFGLPIELFPRGTTWRKQLRLLREFEGDAKAFGHECLRRARLVGNKLHIRRATDSETRTPFDCYHYRIIYQTFHGMRDVLARLANTRGTSILPFDRITASTTRVVVEACPGSTLKRMQLPHQNYKQPAGGALTRKRLLNRRQIVERIGEAIDIGPGHRRVMMRNPGGDALDAVIAATGVLHAFERLDPRRIASHARYSREGLVFA